MAIIKPFQAYRYSPAAGDPSKLVTQPYDKITPEMRAHYLQASPYNLVRIILGEPRDPETAFDNVYTRAAQYLNDWIRDRILVQDPEPGFYAYFQDFEMPDSRERLRRKGLIALGRLEDYSSGIVYRHEQTLAGPKRDRLELLRHTRAHFGQIFMLYPDEEAAVDRLLDQTAAATPALSLIDEFQTRHSLWPVTDPSLITSIEVSIAPKKLLIADGHHRYETALAYRDEHPDDAAAQFVMMTLVNLHSPGVKILATHRVLSGLPHFDPERFFEKAVSAGWSVSACDSLAKLKERLAHRDEKRIQFGVVAGDNEVRWMQHARKPGQLDVPVLHRDVLGALLGVSEEAVHEQRYVNYVRGIDAAAEEVARGAQVAFLLEPTRIDEMARVAFAGGVMPQKSTDFYPKLLSGVAIYKL
ncbi:MAG TPA: DUF1015 domain-containing protein [Bryobacteraceae bacterium]|nr:DUF1015 domain-containing protein [Bryobacteraceae bacterium]